MNNNMNITNIPVEQIMENPKNRTLDQDTVKGIADTFSYTGGLLQPIEVAPVNGSGEYMVTDGHHRFAAVKMAELQDVPCIIIENLTDEDRFLRSLIPNIHRKEMAYSEKVKVMKHLADAGDTLDPAEIARKLGVRPATAAEMVFVAELDETFVGKADTNPAYKAAFHRFARLPKANRDLIATEMGKFHEKVGKWPTPEQFDSAVNKLKLSIEHACFDTTECMRCPSNTHCQTSLFADDGDPEKGVCTNADCYRQKETEAINNAGKREADKYGVDHSLVCGYVGDKSIVSDIIPIKISGEMVDARPWKEIDLADNADGCQGCKHRMVLTQKMPGRVAAQCVCANTECYEKLMPKVELEQVQDDVSESTSATSTSAQQQVKGSTKKAAPDKLTLNANMKTHRRNMLNQHVTEALKKAAPDQKLRAIYVGMQCQASEVTRNGVNEDILHGEPAVIINTMMEMIERSVPSLVWNSLVHLFHAVSDDQQYKEAWTHKDFTFLKSLTRAELLLMLDEAGASSDENFWKEARKAKKGDEENGLVKMAYDFDFKGYVPEIMMPDAK